LTLIGGAIAGGAAAKLGSVVRPSATPALVAALIVLLGALQELAMQKRWYAALMTALVVIGASAVSTEADASQNQAVASEAVSAALIVRGLDDGKRVVLSGNTRAEAFHPEFDRGPVPVGFRLTGLQIQLCRSASQQAAAEYLATALQKAQSPVFHHWLTAKQYAAQFGASPMDIANITSWLVARGFRLEAMPGDNYPDRRPR
jgi:hypothetical protein